MMTATRVPLGLVAQGRSAIVRDVDGGTQVRKRLTDMGLITGTRIKVLRNDQFGPMVVSIGDGRVAFGRGVALKIVVDETD